MASVVTRARKLRPAAVVASAGLRATLASACATPPGAGNTPGAVSLTYLNTLPLESLTYAPELVADTKGFFAAAGVNVDFQFVNGTPPAIAAIMSGKGALSRAGDSDIIKSIANKGAQVVNVGAVQKGGTTIRIVSSRRDPIATPEDLRGKVIGEAALGGTTEGILSLLLSQARMRVSDVKQQVVGMSAGVFNLVQQGRLDGYMLSLDTALQLQATDPDVVVLDPSKYIAAGSQDYITSSAQDKEPAKQDAIKRYLKAIQSAVQFLAQDKATGYAETIKAISSKYKVPAFADQQATKAALDAYLETWTAGGLDKAVQVDPDGWAETYRELAAAGLVRDGQDPAQWVDDTLAPES